MIIFRYLIKEILSTLTAATVVLLLIFLSTQFVHYLSAAALGKYSTEILMHIMMLQIPYLLGLLIPVGFFTAILLSYGRLHTDREMVVLSSCGMSQNRLIVITLSLGFIVAIITAILNLWAMPIVSAQQKIIIAQAKAAPLIETILPGRFYSSDTGNKILYVERISNDHNQMQNIFVAEKETKNPAKMSWSVMVANRGMQQTLHGDHFIVVNDGQRYSGVPGNNNFQVDDFGKYFFRITSNNLTKSPLNEQTMPTISLLKELKTNPNAQAEWQWRISMPISVLILALLAIPLSQVNPRQGRYAQLLPAVFIYILYANMMFVTRTWIQSRAIPGWLGVWWLHGLLLLLAIILLARQGNWWTLYKTSLKSKNKNKEPIFSKI